MADIKNGYSICLNKWALDNGIKDELGTLLIVSSLCASNGYCFASNEYLAGILKTTTITISRRLKKLAEKGYISIDYEKRGCEVVARTIRLTQMLTDDYHQCYSTINTDVKENNIRLNNKEKDNISNNILSTKKFTKPSVEEVKQYCLERNNSIDANEFVDFYESKGWKIGKEPMKDWKACIRTWERNRRNNQKVKGEIKNEKFYEYFTG